MTSSYSISGRLASRVALLVGVGLTVIVLLIYGTTAMLMQNKHATERAQKIEIVGLVAREAASACDNRSRNSARLGSPVSASW